MSIPKYEADEKLGAVAVALMIVAVAAIPAAFWASIAWLVWGWLPAIIVATLALFGSIFVMGIVRSGREFETPRRVPPRNQIAPAPLMSSTETLQQAA